MESQEKMRETGTSHSRIRAEQVFMDAEGNVYLDVLFVII